jgi:hypothetical protein
MLPKKALYLAADAFLFAAIKDAKKRPALLRGVSLIRSILSSGCYYILPADVFFRGGDIAAQEINFILAIGFTIGAEDVMEPELRLLARKASAS